jgi:hypothetical protein
VAGGSRPIVQFPNPPLIVSLVCGLVAGSLEGEGARIASALSTVALTAWAHEELADGVNAFRRLLGLAFVVLSVATVAHAMRH